MTEASQPGGSAATKLPLRRIRSLAIKAAKWSTVTLVVNCVVLFIFFAIGLPLYVWPTEDRLQKADAVFVLGTSPYAPDTGEAARRVALGIQLVRDGWAPTLVVPGSANTDRNGPGMPCDPKVLQCYEPSPPSTMGEGRALRRLAELNGWRRVIVITFRPQISRARYILERCFSGNLIMLESPADMPLSRWIFEYVYQTAGYIKAVFDHGCSQ